MSKIDFQILTENDLEAAIYCIESAFISGEPMFKALSLTTEQFRSGVAVICQRVLEQGLSVIAKDNQSGKVVGCAIGKDFMTDMLDGTEAVSPKLYPVFHLLEMLDENYKAQHSVQPGELLHFLLLGVIKPFTNQGIGRLLTLELHHLAQKHHYQGVILEATGPISQHIFLNRLNYQEIDAIYYREFEYEGQKVFSSITECESCQLLIHSF